MDAVTLYMLIVCASSAWPCPVQGERDAQSYTLTRSRCLDAMRSHMARSPGYTGYCVARGGVEVIDETGRVTDREGAASRAKSLSARVAKSSP